MHDHCPNCYLKALGVIDSMSPAQADDLLRGTAQALGITDESDIDDILTAFKQLDVSLATGKKGGRRTRGKKGKRSGSRKKRSTRGKKRAGKKRAGKKSRGSKSRVGKRTRRR